MIDAKARLRKITKTKSKKRHFYHSLHKSGTSGHFMSLISCKQKHDSTFPNNGRPLTILCYSRKSCMEESSIKRSKCRTSKSLTWTAVSATSCLVVASSASAGSCVFSGCLPLILVDFCELSSLVIGQPYTFEAGRMSERLYHSYARGYLCDPRQVKIFAVHTSGSKISLFIDGLGFIYIFQDCHFLT